MTKLSKVSDFRRNASPAEKILQQVGTNGGESEVFRGIAAVRLVDPVSYADNANKICWAARHFI